MLLCVGQRSQEDVFVFWILGLGPIPQEVGTPGLKALMSTRMHMEIRARQQAESKNRAYEQHITELEEERMTNAEVLS